MQREELGGVLVRVREAGKSMALRFHVRNPLALFYRWQGEMKQLAGPSPAADLRFFMGKAPSKRASRRVVYFNPEEAPQLLQTCKAAFPRWHPFVATCLLTGLRWGEAAALMRVDLDWKRGREHVERAFSERGCRIEPCKDKDDRCVKLTPSLQAILQKHLEAIDLEAQVKGWAPEPPFSKCQTAKLCRVAWKFR